jgi:CBS domain-containing protein
MLHRVRRDAGVNEVQKASPGDPDADLGFEGLHTKGDPMPRPRRTITRDIRTRRAKRPGRDLDELDALTWPERAIRVKDLMTQAPTTVDSNATVGVAWKLMRDRKIRHLPVLDEDKRLIGIVTDRDLREVILEPSIQERLGTLARSVNIVTVKDVMTWGVITVRPDTGIGEAARIIRDQKIGALPVLEGGRVVGMLTATDLVKALLDVLDEGVVSKPERWRRSEG